MRRPVHDALPGRHQSERAQAIGPERLQIRRRVADAGEGQAGAVRPLARDDSPDAPRGEPAERGGIEALQIDDVEGHARLSHAGRKLESRRGKRCGQGG